MRLRTLRLRYLAKSWLQWLRAVRQSAIAILHRSPTWLVCSVSVLVLGAIALYSDPNLTRPEDLLSRKVLAVLFDRAEAIAIIMAVVLFYKEAPDRKLRKHKDLLKVLDAAAHITNSQARKWALETLSTERVSLARSQLSKVDLIGINLSHADLRNSNLEQSNLESAKLSHVHAQEINLSAANLRNADLWGAKLWRANFTDANLQYAQLTKSKLSSANLVKANLQHANLTKAYLWRANLQGANLTDTNLQNTILWEANLEDADLSGAMHLTKDQLKGANLNNTKMPNGLVARNSRWPSLSSLHQRLNALKLLGNG